MSKAPDLRLRRAVQSFISKSLVDRAQLTAADDDDDDRDRMKVLIDGDAMKLLQSIYNEYVSDDDYVDFLIFAKKVDKLLLKARGGRPLTREEREEKYEEKPSRKKKRKAKSEEAPPEDLSAPQPDLNNSGQEVTSSDTNTSFIAQFMAKNIADQRSA